MLVRDTGVAAVMERNQRVNSSDKLLLLVLIEWSGGEANRSERSLKQV